MRTYLVLAGGEHAIPPEIPADAYVVAADSGLALAARLGLGVDLVVGDMDSVHPMLLAKAEAEGAQIQRHPVDKDATDLELALAAVSELGPGRVIVLGGEGGRVDHLLANILLLASPAWSGLDLEWWVEGARIVPVRDRAEFQGRAGDVLTLLAVGAPVTGIETTGLRFALADDTLAPFSTRGVSNELTESTATVAVGSGVLLAVHEQGG